MPCRLLCGNMVFVKERAGSSVIPVLRYKDATTAIDWLADSFGFEKGLVVPGQGNTIRHSQLVFGRGMIMVGSERDGEPADLSSMYVVVSSIAAHYERARLAGAEVVTPLGEQEDRGLFYSCKDPEGRVWNFGEYDPWIG